ncbi:TonB-linked SusC/RagA family outer membrane protein [Dyadobacter jejuensis]|uniref:TonB-linked SusC/RagA family outer membrane protein n=1 Tax=Dyadobacter jejuensis TaxID=1082580 RepID=A0A316AIZ8_9BACT|nr:TonB-dependent receptor [Dyadobacter jejuensis]PWJ57209.1 TonB-linked SusC/RagA family outer membrane protein [Dyadobacter jejuensis]
MRKFLFAMLHTSVASMLVLMPGSKLQAYAFAAERSTMNAASMSSKADLTSGRVLDENGDPLIGVTILAKSSNTGTVTDQEGKFSIEVMEGATLVFSFVGYITQEVQVTKRSLLEIQLKPDAMMLNEVVAVGYQTLRKSDLTGAISSVKAKELNLTTPTVGQALVGKVAGVQISQVSGAPYVGTKIRVRGVGSVNASSDPLYVVDGYPAGTDIFINPNDIESIDILKDAASAAIYGSRAAGGVVLITTKRGKEGKGTLEYDYQFGVHQLAHKVDLLNASEFTQLLIDARNNTYRDLMVNSGKAWNDGMFSDDNATRIKNVGSASAVSIPTDLYDLSTQQMIKPQYDTDWQDELYRNAVVQRHNVSFSGGKDGVRYALSGGYLSQEGIMKGTGQDRYNFRANIDGQVNRRLTVGANLAFTSNKNKEVREGRFNQGPILGALIYMPIFKAYNEDGSLAKNEAASLSSAFGYQTIENPIALATETHINRNGLRGTYNGFVTYEILPALKFKVNLGLQTYQEKYEFYQPTSLSSSANPPGSPQAIAAAYAVAQTQNQVDQMAEFTFDYNKQFGDHRISALAGYTAQRNSSDVISVTARGFQNDNIEEITAKGADATAFGLNSGTGKVNWSLLSYLARVMYQYDSRYYLTASFRTDGSSRFGPNNRWGNFPSVSAGWNLSNESFYGDWLGKSSTLKLRASWGLSGNNNIGNYRFLQTMATPGGVVFGNGTVNTAMWAEGIKDQDLGWESTSQFNFGADLGLLNDRLSIIANYYISRSFNLLFDQPISAISGSSSILTNLRNSKVENKGLDVQVDARVVSTKDWTVNVNGNISINRNKVLDMGGASTIITNGAERSYKTHITEEGQPIGMFYGFKVKGMVRASDMENLAIDNANYNASTQSFPDGYVLKGPARSASSTNPLQPGDIYFEDVNGDGVVNDSDKTVIGSPHAKFTYGFGLSARYKQLDFTSSFNGSYGNKVLDGQDYYLFNMEASGNQYKKVVNRYRSEAEPGNGQVYRASRGGTQSNSTRLSTFYLQDGSFLRCTNISLGYNLPQIAQYTKGAMSNLRIYASVDNAFTVTKYLGYNPEVDYNDGANLTPGVDYGKYPLARAYSIGAKITF